MPTTDPRTVLYRGASARGLRRPSEWCRDWRPSIQPLPVNLLTGKSVREDQSRATYVKSKAVIAKLKTQKSVDMTRLARAHYNEGVRFLRMDSYQEALKELNSALEFDTSIKGAFFTRGYVKSALGDFSGAIGDYRQAIMSKPDDFNAYSNRGNAWLEMDDYEMAIDDFNKAIEIAPEYAYAYNNRGYVLLEKMEYAQAILDFNKAIEINPGYTNALNNRGNAWLENGEYGKAIDDFNKAIKIDPDNAIAYNNRGNACLSKKEYRKAIDDYSKAITINPIFAMAYDNRAYLFTTCEDESLRSVLGAVADAAQACSIDKGDYYFQSTLAAVYAEMGSFDEAIETQWKAISLVDNNPEDIDILRGGLELYARGMSLSESDTSTKLVALESRTSYSKEVEAEQQTNKTNTSDARSLEDIERFDNVSTESLASMIGPIASRGGGASCENEGRTTYESFLGGDLGQEVRLTKGQILDGLASMDDPALLDTLEAGAGLAEKRGLVLTDYNLPSSETRRNASRSETQPPKEVAAQKAKGSEQVKAEPELSEKKQKALLYGELLREIHNKSGFKAQDVAAKIGKSPTELSRYLNGKHFPASLEIRRKLAIVYGEPGLEADPATPSSIELPLE